MRSLTARIWIGILISGAILATALSQEIPQPAPAKKPQGPRVCQLVLFKLGPAWDKGKPIMQQPGIQEHSTYMTKLVKEGTLVLGGPLMQDVKTMAANGAMMILAADSEEIARQILAADPAEISGLIQITEIRPFMVTGASWRPAQAQ
jgi:uncharacterized protein YciI